MAQGVSIFAASLTIWAMGFVACFTNVHFVTGLRTAAQLTRALFLQMTDIHRHR